MGNVLEVSSYLGWDEISGDEPCTMDCGRLTATCVSEPPEEGRYRILIPKVSSAAACPPGGDGWYYDDNNAPSTIILCDDTCAKVSADTSGKVDIVIGCATVAR